MLWVWKVIRDQRIRLVLAPDDDVGESDDESNQCGHHILLSVGFAAPHASGLAFLPAARAVRPVPISPAKKIQVVEGKANSVAWIFRIGGQGCICRQFRGRNGGVWPVEYALAGGRIITLKKRRASIHGAKIETLKS
jgi:hypothetical protein